MHYSTLNNVYTELGGSVEGKANYLVIFSTDHSPQGKVLNSIRIGIKNEPRDLAMLCAVKNFDSVRSSGNEVSDAFMVPGIPLGAAAETDGYFDFGGKWAPQRATGLIWLTSYKLGEAAHNPHLLQRCDGNIFILWEKSGPDGSAL